MKEVFQIWSEYGICAFDPATAPSDLSNALNVDWPVTLSRLSSESRIWFSERRTTSHFVVCVSVDESEEFEHAELVNRETKFQLESFPIPSGELKVCSTTVFVAREEFGEIQTRFSVRLSPGNHRLRVTELTWLKPVGKESPLAQIILERAAGILPLFGLSLGFSTVMLLVIGAAIFALQAITGFRYIEPIGAYLASGVQVLMAAVLIFLSGIALMLGYDKLFGAKRHTNESEEKLKRPDYWIEITTICAAEA